MFINLQLKNDIIQNRNISDFTLAVYIALKKNCISTNEFQIVTPCWIDYLLTDNLKTKLNQRARERILKAFDELKEQTDIEITNCDGAKTFVISNKSIMFDFSKGNYTTIDFDIVKQLLKEDKKKRWGLFHYYVWLTSLFISKVTVFDFDGISTQDILICNYSISELSSMLGISEPTIMEYNKILVDKKLIHINNVYNIVTFYKRKAGEKHNTVYTKNVYGKYIDKDYIDKYITDKYRHQCSKANKKSLDIGRSLTQKYRYLVKCPNTDKYSNKEIQEIYDYILAQNEKFQNTINKYQRDYSSVENESLDKSIQNMKNKIKDLSVFDRFDFLEK